jgi:predicted nuclease of predicted toxin-antitoxin system
VRFIVDAQLPPALARHLQLLGHEAEHVIDLGLERASDRDIWEVAAAQSAIIVTKDEDFGAMRAIQQEGPAILWIRTGNTTTPTLLETLMAAWPLIFEALERGEPIIEVT